MEVSKSRELVLVGEDVSSLLCDIRTRISDAISEAVALQYYSGDYQMQIAKTLLSLVADMSNGINIAFREVDAALNGE